MSEAQYRRPVDVGATSPNRRKVQIRRLVRLSVNLGMLTVLVTGASWLWNRTRSDERFRISEITLEAPDRAGADVSAIIESYRGRNLFEVDLEEVSTRLDSIDWIAESSIEKLVPHTLRVEIVERIPVAIVSRQNRDLWVSADGRLFEPWAGYDDAGLPRVETSSRPHTIEALHLLASLERRDPQLRSRVERLTPLAHRQWVIGDRELGTKVIVDESRLVTQWRALYGIAQHEKWPPGAIEYADLRFDRQIVVQNREQTVRSN